VLRFDDLETRKLDQPPADIVADADATEPAEEWEPAEDEDPSL
jgi:hypothetical protein